MVPVLANSAPSLPYMVTEKRFLYESESDTNGIKN